MEFAHSWSKQTFCMNISEVRLCPHVRAEVQAEASLVYVKIPLVKQ